MNDLKHEPERRYAAIVAELTAEPGVVQSVKRGFAQYGLKVDGKLFASPWRKGGLILKLPRSRVVWLSEAGDGRPFDPTHGRPMKEWIVINDDAAIDWLDLAREAMEFVRGVRKA
jgi:hypothetical protein